MSASNLHAPRDPNLESASAFPLFAVHNGSTQAREAGDQSVHSGIKRNPNGIGSECSWSPAQKRSATRFDIRTVSCCGKHKLERYIYCGNCRAGSLTSCVSTPIALMKTGRISLISMEHRFGNYLYGLDIISEHQNIIASHLR